MNNLDSPLQSLKNGHWFKLICGASFQDLCAIRSLALAYTLAGVDCIDLAADVAVINVVKDTLALARQLVQQGAPFSWRGFPLIMVSLNDGEDPHFRKAEFDPNLCPPDCPRPCEKVCPPSAITFNEHFSGVISQRCYGCGRCLPICPHHLITTRFHLSTPSEIAPLITERAIDALEIHTQVGHEKDFSRLWETLTPLSSHLKLLAISCQDHPEVIDYLRNIWELISPLNCPLIWQTDGRPMSGDIGKGTTHAAIKMARKVLAAGLPGYVQLAGGTNHHTVTKLEEIGLLQGDKNQQSTESKSKFIAGIAYGSYARSILMPVLEQLETKPYPENMGLENYPELLEQAVNRAYSLVSSLKSRSSFYQNDQ